jgi:response regulator NasT
MKTLDSLTVLVAHSNEATFKVIKAALEQLGCAVIDGCLTAASLVRRAFDEEPDLIVTGIGFPDSDGVSALLEISQFRAIPSIVVTTQRSMEVVERAARDHVMAYLIEPVEREDVQPAVYVVLKRFEEFEELRSEVIDLRQALSDRKVIERAKGIIMHRDELTEEASYKLLRRMATDHRIKLVEAARQVLDVAEADGREAPAIVVDPRTRRL